MKLKEVRGDGIEACRKYLKKVIGMPFPDQSRSWQEVTYLRRVRNVIVHNDGRPQLCSGLLTQLAKDPHASVKNHGRMELEPGFARAAIAAVRTFLNEFEAAAKPIDGFGSSRSGSPKP